ncbi:MAG: DUF2270 domain-containing protein [Chthoniobacterales bacterium]|nr:DUF2270 domain-containing protein [Chthoniobacterales bacterium]
MEDRKTSTTGTRELEDPCYVNAMSHFYRGELGRIMVWRQRLDITTNWAITSTTTIITVAFSFRDIPHIVFFFNLVIVLMMLWIEARRYRFYDAFRGRVRMLESHFLVAIVSRNPALLGGDWQRLVCEDLILPSFKISKLEAVGRRLKRNYIFIIAVILVAWMTKLFMHAKPPIHSLGAFYQALGVGELPGWFVGVILAFTIVGSIALTWYVSFNTAGEVTDLRGSHKEQWRI